MIPVLVAVYYTSDALIPAHSKNIVATVLFVAAALTDWLDGYLARRMNLTSAFGAFLDPVADKLMVAAALIMLVGLQRVEDWVAVVIIGREIAISALREWMAQMGAAKSVAVNMLGKVKTVAQMIAIPMLLWFDPIAGVSMGRVGNWLIYLAAVLTLVSMVYYMKLALPSLRGRTARP